MATTIEAFVGKYLLNKLAAFAEEKVVMVLGLKEELSKLQRRMRRIAAYIQDAERRRIADESVIIDWLNELKDVMYDADDMIDIWNYKIQIQSLPCDKSSSSSKSQTSYCPFPLLISCLPSSSSNSQTCCPLPVISCYRSIPRQHEAAQQIKSLNSRLEDILNDMARLNLNHVNSENEVIRVDARESSPVMEVDVVGNEIEEDANKLIKMAVIDNKKKFNLIALTGMGGIGKTTLAQKLYNNTTMQNRYEKRIWLSVSQSNSTAQLIKVAIRNVGGNLGDVEMVSELLPILVDAISGKSFFLVLDDVWHDPNLNRSIKLLQGALESSATNGFILVTTRDQTVGMKMGARYIHQIKLLSPKFGWELLCKRAYLTDIGDLENLEDVGIKIVEKCGNLPLAIQAIGGMLSTRNVTKHEWENVLQSNTWSTSGLPNEIHQAL